MSFTYVNYGTFTGPNSISGDYNYDAVSQENVWWGDLPTDTSFKLTDLAAVLFADVGDYVGFYCLGTSTELMTLAHSTGNIPLLDIQADNTIINGNILANGDVIANGAITLNGAIAANGILTLTGVGDVASSINSKKSFDIPHPNKPDHRLRHVCVEGPESAVYVRGKLDSGNIIKLPDYWDGLIDPETISVHLTPIGSYQELFVERVEWGKNIVVKNQSGGSIHCYYKVWADRLGEKLIVEYPGKTPADYPGNSNEYSIAGYDYDRR